MTEYKGLCGDCYSRGLDVCGPKCSFRLNSPEAVKHDQDKYDPTMLSIELIELVSRVRMFGSKKYSRNNWKGCFATTRSLAAALRHLFAYLNGEDNDPESGLSHLGHAICSIEHEIYRAKHRPDLDDRKV